MTSRRELAAQLEHEFARLRGTLKPGAARQIIDTRVNEVAAAMRIQPASALRYIDQTAVRQIGQRSMQTLNENEAHEDTLPDQLLTVADIALAAPVFTICARLGIVNGDPDVAADLCEASSALTLALRQGGDPVWVQPSVLLNGLRWCWLVTEQLASGAWQVQPDRSHGSDDEDAEQLLHTRLSADLHAIAALAPPGSTLPPGIRQAVTPITWRHQP